MTRMVGNGDPAESERLAQTYDAYGRDPRKAGAWAAANPGNAAMRAELWDAFVALAGPRLMGGEILDVGCGRGFWLREIAAAGASAERLHGAELIPERVAAAQAAVPGADIRLADARELPWPDASFDVVLLFTVLSSMPDRTAVIDALAHARRVLRPGGVAVVYEPRLPNPHNRATRLVGKADLAAGLGAATQSRSITLVPALARRLRGGTEKLYPRLASVP